MIRRLILWWKWRKIRKMIRFQIIKQYNRDSVLPSLIKRDGST